MPEQKPLNIFLIFVIIGTSILATAGTIGLFVCFDNDVFGRLLAEPFGLVFLAIITLGYALCAGYILTAIYQKHLASFWFCSMIYNLIYSLIYLLLAVADSNFRMANIYEFNPLFVPLGWTSFVTYSSWYYYKFALGQRKSNFK